MNLLALLLLISTGLWFVSAVPNSRVPEWAGRLGFFITALVWVLT